jgi:S1-C subfamily serine protease
MAILIALLTAGSAGARAQGEEDPSDDDLRLARSMERVFLRVAETTLPSVVQILVRYGEGAARPAGSGRRERGLRVQGSGFFVGADGLILTNAHVVQGADALAVRLHDGREHDADVVGIRESVDLALLRISVPGTPLTWGDGARLRPGSIVFSVGSPYGNRSSVSQGIVSGIGRAGPQGGDDVTYIQTDAAINAGNSGGPLLDLEGMVVGVNTWIYAPSGLSRGVGFALPGDLAREVTATLLAQARSPVLARSDRDPVWMGILPAAPDDEGLGLALSHVFAASPAARAGIRTGDRLMRIEGSVVSSRAVIDAVLDARVPGDTVRVELAGGGSRMLAVTLRPQHLPGSTGDDALPPPAHAPEDATEVTDGVLRGRSCTGGCGYDVLSCFGCSAALADRALAHDLARRGLDQGEIRRRLSPAVTVTVWADYTDPEGRAALRLADRLQARFGSLVRVVRRHYPENAHLPPDRWRDTINALELARAHGRYEDAHTWLVTDSGLTWIERLEQMPRRLGIDDEEFWLGIHENRHRAVIRHDLAVAPSEFAVTNQPTLDVNGTLFRGPFTADELATYVGRAVIASAR